MTNNKLSQNRVGKEEGHTFGVKTEQNEERCHGENYLVSRVPNSDIVVLATD